MKAVRLLPALAQYQLLSAVKVPKYCSSTMRPSFNTMKALLLLPSRKS
jgi:hypothetical protein